MDNFLFGAVTVLALEFIFFILFCFGGNEK